MMVYMLRSWAGLINQHHTREEVMEDHQFHIEKYVTVLQYTNNLSSSIILLIALYE